MQVYSPQDPCTQCKMSSSQQWIFLGMIIHFNEVGRTGVILGGCLPWVNMNHMNSIPWIARGSVDNTHHMTRFLDTFLVLFCGPRAAHVRCGLGLPVPLLLNHSIVAGYIPFLGFLVVFHGVLDSNFKLYAFCYQCTHEGGD
jgi:hypothetical protein